MHKMIMHALHVKTWKTAIIKIYDKALYRTQSMQHKSGSKHSGASAFPFENLNMNEPLAMLTILHNTLLAQDVLEPMFIKTKHDMNLPKPWNIINSRLINENHVDWLTLNEQPCQFKDKFSYKTSADLLKKQHFYL